MHLGGSIRRPCALRALALGLILALAAPLALTGTWPGAGVAARAQGVLAPKTDQTQTAVPQGVTITGNRRIETATILSYMQLPTNRPVTAADLNAAVRRLYDTGLFQDVKILPAAGGGVTVQVVENPSINKIAFEGNSKLKDEDLLKIIHLRPRLPFTKSAAEADAQAIIDVYRRLGRYAAEVEPVIIKRPENRVDLIFQIKEGSITGVKSIDFVGNKHFSDSRLRDVINTTESSWLSFLFSTDVYDPDRLELDKELLRQFYQAHGYADFTVLSATAELSKDRTGFYITFTVSEGPQYKFGPLDVTVEAKGLDKKIFTDALPKDIKGDIYDASRVDKIANKLTDLAGQHGFAFIQVKPIPHKDEKTHTIGITFDMAEGSRIYVERINIEGNVRTLDRVIRREMQLVEGDAFDARKIRESRSKIRGLDYFKSVDITTTQGSSPNKAVLTVKVEEKSTGSLSLGLGYSSAVGPIGNVALTERNFLGRGQIVDARVTAAGKEQLYNFSFTEPRFLDRDLSVTGHVFYLQDNRKSTSSYKLNSFGFGPQVGFPLSEDLRLRLRYTIQHDDVIVDPGASPAIQADQGQRYTSSVGYTLTYDQRNDIIEPTRGYLLTFDQEIAGLGGDSRYIKSRGTAKFWHGFFDNSVIASVEFDAGALTSFGHDSRLTERYFIGGDQFIGFQDHGIGPRDTANLNDGLGGNFYGVTRTQVSFPLGLPKELGIYGGVFMDVGTLWGLDKTVYPATGTSNPANIDDSAHLRASTGFLLFLDTPFGPLQLDFGVPLIKESYDKTEFFRLTLGTRF